MILAQIYHKVDLLYLTLYKRADEAWLIETMKIFLDITFPGVHLLYWIGDDQTKIFLGFLPGKEFGLLENSKFWQTLCKLNDFDAFVAIHTKKKS